MYISEVVVHSGVELTALYQKLFVIFWLHIHIHERTNFLYVYIYIYALHRAGVPIKVAGECTCCHSFERM